MSVVSVYAIFANAEEAERIGRDVVEQRLAACINILGPVRSIYRWKGEVETADALIVRIAALHSYDVPCVVALPLDKVLQPYALWVEDSVR